MSTLRLLLAEPDVELADRLATYFALEGWRVDRVGSGAAAVSALLNDPEYDAVVVQRRLPDGDAVELLPALRQRTETPIAVLIPRATVDDRVRALRAGADEALASPCSPEELALRLRVLRRRTQPQSWVMRTIDLGGLRLDLDTRQAWAGETLLELTVKEFDLLACLAQSPGRVLTRQALLAEVWGHTVGPQVSATVTEHVHRLRTKITSAGGPDWISTVRGMGYKLERRLPRVAPDADVVERARAAVLGLPRQRAEEPAGVPADQLSA